MASRKVKCPKCGKSNDKEIAVKYNNRYYCKECIEDVEEYKELIEAICQIYELEAPTMQIVKQIKDYKDKYNFTNSGILFTLKYYYQILENKVLEDSGIGIVPYYYDKARDYYNKKFELEEYAKTFEKNEKIIYRKPEQKQQKYIKKDLDIYIDWSEQFEE